MSDHEESVIRGAHDPNVDDVIAAELQRLELQLVTARREAKALGAWTGDAAGAWFAKVHWPLARRDAVLEYRGEVEATRRMLNRTGAN